MINSFLLDDFLGINNLYFRVVYRTELSNFYVLRLYSLAWQLSPVAHSSGIEQIETDQYKLYCFHTITGIKFIAIADSRQANVDTFLRKTYEIYTDYALKNPFYLMDQPIRSDLFDTNIQNYIDNIDRI